MCVVIECFEFTIFAITEIEIMITLKIGTKTFPFKPKKVICKEIKFPIGYMIIIYIFFLLI